MESDCETDEEMETTFVPSSDISDGESATSCMKSTPSVNSLLSSEGNTSTASSSEENEIMDELMNFLAACYDEELQDEDDDDEGVDALEDHEPIYPGAPITNHQNNVAIMAFKLKVGLADKHLGLLLKLLSLQTNHKYLPSQYKFLKRFPTEKPEKHYFCPIPTCQSSVVETDQPDSLECSICDEKYDKKTLDRTTCFFLYLPIEPQLASIISDPRVTQAIDLHKSRPQLNSIINSKRYKALQESGVIGPNDYTLQFNTDGVQITEASDISLWPLILGVNELPPKERKKNLIVAGVWFKKQKPKMDTFLVPMVEELKKLSNEGFDHNGTRIRFHCLLCTVDSQARCMVMNIHQYNGEYSCPWCLNPGESFKKRPDARGSSKLFLPIEAEMRTERQYLEHATLACEQGKYQHKGVKSISCLALLNTFDAIDGHVIDYLHNLLLGVLELLLEAWLGTQFSNEEWSLRKHTSTLDKRLLNITPSSEISRLPEKLSDYKNMKASLKRSILCYYLVPLVADLLPEKYLQHLLLLVFSARTFLQETVDADRLVKAKTALRQFVENVPELYHKSLCKFNMHILVHTAEHCENWGAIWDYSCFMYEGYNATLIQSFYGTVSQGQQILQTHQLIQFVRRNYNAFSSQQQLNFYQSCTSNIPLVKKATKYNNITTLDAGKPLELKRKEKQEIEFLLGETVSDSCKVHRRFHVDDTICNSIDYTRMKRRRDYVFQDQEGNVVAIKFLLIVKTPASEVPIFACCKCFQQQDAVVVVDQLEISSLEAVDSIKVDTKNIHFVKSDCIKEKLVCFDVEKKVYISSLVNHMDPD